MDTTARFGARDLESAVRDAVTALRGGVDRDWSVPAGQLRWSCSRTAGHIADDLLAYSGQLASGARDDYLPFRTRAVRGTSPTGLLELIEGMAALFAAVVRAAPAQAKAYHPYGLTDAEGFTALATAEVVLHTHDIAAGLGVPYRPSGALCTRLTARLHRDIEHYHDPWTLLLWATGRADIAGRDRVRRWRWWPAPHDA